MSVKPTPHPLRKSFKRAKTCPPRRKRYYFTTGRNVTEESIKEMEKEILKPYEPHVKFEHIEEVKKYWEEEKRKRIKEREADYTNHHNFKSRMNLSWKFERLFVAEKIDLPGVVRDDNFISSSLFTRLGVISNEILNKLSRTIRVPFDHDGDFTPGGSLTEDIDPTFFQIVSGRPIKQNKSIRQYLQDIRNCFLTRLTTGYYRDEILLMDESHKNERKKFQEIKENFLSCLKGFETFLQEDHESSLTLLETAKNETKNSKEKLAKITSLKEELKDVETDLLLVEEKWRSLRMFQNFLNIISPSEWRKVHDPCYGKEDVGVITSDPCLFDSFREFPGDGKLDLEVKILKFQEDTKEKRPPTLYFTDPQDLINILEDLERNNLRALTHSKDLDFPLEKMMAELEKVKLQFEKDQKSIEEDIKYIKEMIELEEKKAKENESKMRKTVFGLFRDLITNEEYLSVTAYVEDAYEDATEISNTNLNPVEMMKEIELKYESVLLALDKLPNDIMTRTTKIFFKQEKKHLKEAIEAEKKVRQMETLLKRLSKSLMYPKKEVKERKIVPRSVPSEELMFKYKLPKIVSRERKDHLFFFGKTPDNVRLYKPLCL